MRFWAFLALVYCSIPVTATLYSSPDEMRFLSPNESSESVAAMIPSHRVRGETARKIHLRTDQLGTESNLCPDEPFQDEIVIGACTGFLIDHDLLLTAGHCVRDQGECERNVWLFDFFRNKNSLEMGYLAVDPHRVATCKKLELQIVSGEFDLALVRLDRPMGRTSLDLLGQSSGVEKVDIVGHPRGMPLMSSGIGDVISLDGNYLLAKVNSFNKNSGSPVFSAVNGALVGMLISGNRDFTFAMGDPLEPKCNRFFRCTDQDESCLGEKILRIEVIRDLIYPARVRTVLF